jgi:toxin ParE1/3/4
MRAARFALSKEADRDLVEIWSYIALDSVQYADAALDGIEAACSRAAYFPESGRERDDLTLGLRDLVVGNYIIFYTRSVRKGYAIEITRILHASRNVNSILGE